MKFLSFLAVAIVPLFCLSQQKTQQNIKVDNVSGGEVNMNKSVYNNQVITKKTVNYYNTSGKEKVLMFQKYIDTTKPVMVGFGMFAWDIPIDSLKKGFLFSPFLISPGILSSQTDSFIVFKYYKGQLRISCRIDGFDGKYIVRIVDNKIIPSKADFHLYASDHYFEIFDDYYIPVLQIDIKRNSNFITLNGVFHTDKGYFINSRQIVHLNPFKKDKLLMTQQERDSLFNIYLKEARLIKPIHE